MTEKNKGPIVVGVGPTRGVYIIQVIYSWSFPQGLAGLAAPITGRHHLGSWNWSGPSWHLLPAQLCVHFQLGKQICLSEFLSSGSSKVTWEIGPFLRLFILWHYDSLFSLIQTLWTSCLLWKYCQILSTLPTASTWSNFLTHFSLELSQQPLNWPICLLSCPQQSILHPADCMVILKSYNTLPSLNPPHQFSPWPYKVPRAEGWAEFISLIPSPIISHVIISTQTCRYSQPPPHCPSPHL